MWYASAAPLFLHSSGHNVTYGYMLIDTHIHGYYYFCYFWSSLYLSLMMLLCDVDKKQYWKFGLQRPYECGNPLPLTNFLRQTMWRNSKQHVIHEVHSSLSSYYSKQNFLWTFSRFVPVSKSVFSFVLVFLSAILSLNFICCSCADTNCVTRRVVSLYSLL